ncbi:MAG: GMC family oxidoreductase N-terminal domain-containing protein [Pseudomonadota bacterium]
MSDKTYDYIVVGAGTAGCLLANRLSADSSKTVLLIEAGGKDNYPWIHIPIGYLYCIDNPRTDWRFRTEPDTGLNGRQLLYPRGKTLGGCSSINGMIYMRGQSRDYESWAEATGDHDWSWQNVLLDFIAHEDYYKLDESGTNTDLHGVGGEWRIEKQRLRWELLETFAEAAVQAGIPASDDFNQGDNFGVGYFEVNQRKGWRWNAASAFLRPVKNRQNLTILTHTQVKRLLTEKDDDGHLSCQGVELFGGGQTFAAHANNEVILSAGAIGSPQILQLSGIGPRQILDQQGIPVVHELPGVGENLQDHLQIRAMYKVSNVPTLNELASGWFGKFRIGLEYMLFRTGPMSMSPSQLGLFTRSDPTQPHANIEYHVQPLSLEAFGQPLHTYPAFTASVSNINPSSRGTTYIKSPDFAEAPAIAPNYLSTEDDRKVAADSLRVTRDIVNQAALEKYQPEEVKPGPEYQTDEELAARAGDIGTTIFHPVGTAKMGKADDPMAVVDSHLRVRGVKGLRVVDASVMPTITSGNTNSPTLMIAEKAARWVIAGE